ncbi:hypothetical protein B0H14DRAFT_2855897 [Mycena olivaceomarginata]|nr:hypothetical protein B0H14DRAFT_2855897 [Mycena olivaceomarginata]
MLIRPCYLRPCMYYRVRVKIFSDPIIARHVPGALRNADGSPLFEGDVVSVSMSVCPVHFASAAYSSTCCIIGESGDTPYACPCPAYETCDDEQDRMGGGYAAVAHPALGCSCIRAASIVPRAPARLSHTERAPPFSGPPQDCASKCASLAPSCKLSSVGGIAYFARLGRLRRLCAKEEMVRHRLQLHHAHAWLWASGVLEARSGGGKGRGELGYMYGGRGSIAFRYDGPRPRVGAVASFLADYRARPSALPHLSSRRR